MTWGLWLPDNQAPRLHLALFMGSGAWGGRCNTLGTCRMTSEEGLGWEVGGSEFSLLREFDWRDQPQRIVALAQLEKAPDHLRLCKRCVERWLDESYIIETERLRRVG